MLKKIFKFFLYLALFFLVSGIFSYLTISFIVKSEDTVVIPELKSKDVVYVLEMLNALDLNLKFQGAEYSSKIPKYKVISQYPEAGITIKKGRDVRIVFSKGTEMILMPDIRGLNVENAKIILEENNLQTGYITRVSNIKFRKNFTMDQYPIAGSLTKRNSSIDILVSNGIKKRGYRFIDLKGMSLDEAILTIESKGFKTGSIKTVRNFDKPQNTVLEQTPDSGFHISDGQKVDLVINRKVETKNNSFSKNLGCKLFSYELEHGFLNKHIVIKLNMDDMTNIVVDDFKKPGEIVNVLIPGNKDATLFLYEDDELKITEVYDAFE